MILSNICFIEKLMYLGEMKLMDLLDFWKNNQLALYGGEAIIKKGYTDIEYIREDNNWIE